MTLVPLTIALVLPSVPLVLLTVVLVSTSVALVAPAVALVSLTVILIDDYICNSCTYGGHTVNYSGLSVINRGPSGTYCGLVSLRWTLA